MSNASVSQHNAYNQFLLGRPNSEALGMRKRICALEAREQLREAGRKPALPIEFTSQYGEDCWLWELFRGQNDGFFIEVGAYDGLWYSVTYPFESIGWKGLLIEPIPDRYELCRSRRPHSRVVHAAVAGPGSSGTCTFTVVTGDGEGMLSYLTPTVNNTRDITSAGYQTKRVEVPLTTMNDLLAQHTGPIDVAVIDVEGGEVPLLKGFDLERFRPRVLLIEEGMPSPSSDVSKYLSAFPYVPTTFPWINRAYIRKDEEELIRRTQRIPIF